LDQDRTGCLHGDTWQHGPGRISDDAGNAGGAGALSERPRLRRQEKRGDYEGTARDTRHEPLLSRRTRIGPNVLTEMKRRLPPYARRFGASTHEIEQTRIRAPQPGGMPHKIFFMKACAIEDTRW